MLFSHYMFGVVFQGDSLPSNLSVPLFSSLVRGAERLEGAVGTVDGRRQGSNIHKDTKLQIMVERKVCVKSTW